MSFQPFPLLTIVLVISIIPFTFAAKIPGYEIVTFVRDIDRFRNCKAGRGDP
jgi:hypothetical protein